MPYIVHHIGPATAYNLSNPKSTNDSRLKLFTILNGLDKKRDFVILSFGEIDCRIHIYLKYMQNGRKQPLEHFVEETVQHYGDALDEVHDANANFLVLGIPPAGYQGNVYGYEHYAEIEDRIRISRLFNEKMERYCGSKGYRYINVYDAVATDRGLLDRKYARDEIHLNEKVVGIVDRWLACNLEA